MQKESFIVRECDHLLGNIEIDGAKNLATPLIIASLLFEQDLELRNVPKVSDIYFLIDIMRSMNCTVDIIDKSQSNGFTLRLNSAKLSDTQPKKELIQKMRVSILMLGPLSCRLKKARISLPGGCRIGARDIDMHIDVLESMGISIAVENSCVSSSTQKPHATNFTFKKISVGATTQAIFTASMIEDTSIFYNCATEPEIVSICNLLTKAGVKIDGIGTRTLTILGKTNLASVQHDIMPDRLQIGTYIASVGITGGKINLLNTNITPDIHNILNIFRKTGIQISQVKNNIEVISDQPIQPISLATGPYPEFPTDLQSQLMALLCFANGKSILTETVFENRFRHVPELNKMQAKIHINNDSAHIEGIKHLTGCTIEATDLRASAALLIASLKAKNKTVINNIHYIDRGYYNIDKKLNQCGANIQRIRQS